LGKVLANEFWELGIGGQSRKSLGHNFLQRSGELYLTFMTKRKQKPTSSSRFPSNQPGVSRGGQDRGLRIKNSPIRAVLIFSSQYNMHGNVIVSVEDLKQLFAKRKLLQTSRKI
jgi:hypothetical protein